MTRTTIMADEAVLEQLRRIARKEGISLAETIRQALEWRARQRKSRPKFIASGESRRGPHNTARKSGDFQFEPRSWR
jgi:Ribbon-helix-helix protein, copG family